jgi:3-methyladenine DNA glycosylase AlkC
VPIDVRRALQAGTLESANHMEQMALDMTALMSAAFPGVLDPSETLKSPRFLSRMRAGASILWSHFGLKTFDITAGHASDTVRGWGAFAVGLVDGIPLEERLCRARPYADDPHFAVREWAWLGIRAHIVADPLGAVDLLAEWTASPSSSIRRFASEATRPRGVWSVHIEMFKAEPWLALDLLAQLRQDESRYVETSLGNWLNDTAKSHPAWVLATCQRWASDVDDCNSTRRIQRLALRSLRS